MRKEKLQKGFSGYKLTNEAREILLTFIPPKFDKVIAHHVTYEFGVYDLPPTFNKVRVISELSNDKIQAVVVVVMVDGNLTKPDGTIFHITISLDSASDAKPVDSNKLIADGEIADLKFEQFDIEVVPSFFPFKQ